MERKRQRELALGGVVLVILAIVVFRISTFSNSPAGSSPAPTGGSRTAAAGSPPQVPQVDLEALKGQRPQPVESPRDPFRFRPKAAPAPPPTSSGMSRQSGPPIAMGPSEPPPPPRIPLKFIGVLESKTTGTVAILSDGRSMPMYGKLGEVIDGRYQIMRIGVESIDLQYIDGRGRQTIRFTGQ
jgi:hypothetical protein